VVRDRSLGKTIQYRVRFVTMLTGCSSLRVAYLADLALTIMGSHAYKIFGTGDIQSITTR